jgi:hypothetical protein
MRKKLLFILSLVSYQSVQAQHVAQSLVLLNSNLQALNQAIVSQPRTCLVCFEQKIGAGFTTLQCGHEFCTVCLQEMTSQALKEKQTLQLRCPTCAQPFTSADLRALIKSPLDLAALTRIKFEEWARTQEGYKHCPTPGCSFIFLGNKQTPREAMRCPECTKEYCTECLISHAAETLCAEAKGLSAEELANKELKRQLNIKACPKCKVEIEKNFGCQHMTCKNCRYEFCWTCLGVWAGHYNNYSCGKPAPVQQIVQGPKTGLAALVQTDAPQAYIMSWSVGLPESSPIAGEYLAIKQLPIFARIKFNRGVNDFLVHNFFHNFPKYMVPKKDSKFPDEFVITLPPEASRELYQSLLDDANAYMRLTY